MDQELDGLLTADHNLHTRLQRANLPIGVEPRARVRHLNFERLTDAWRASHHYSRCLAVQRARLEGWGGARRLAHALLVLATAPLARFRNLFAGTAGNPAQRARVFLYSPSILVLYLVSACGESLGCLRGNGDASARFMHWEVDAGRTGGDI
jgi:hypothetical protein